ncbi:class I tRNA ligase family protein [Candidatus Pacearchaeota archaeon]|nr:class I tRNA ligase family protein [Candidatus Pacearchaeota archaeon]
MVHGKDGFVMSKSRGNVVDPMEITKKYGTDTLRLFLVSMSSPDKDFSWSPEGIEGSFKFLNRVYNFIIKLHPESKSSAKIEHKLNKAIKEVTKDIEDLKYNLAIIKLRELFAVIEQEKQISKQDIKSFIKLLAPFCPHIAEELWEKIGHKNFVSLAEWPKADEKKINPEIEKQQKILQNTIDDINNIIRIIKEKQNKEAKTIYIYAIPNEKDIYNKEYLSKKLNKEVKVFAVNDKNKHDPQNKASKAKPGKPAIYVE